MTERQIRLALARAAATDVDDDEMAAIAKSVQEFDPSVVDVQTALLAGFCIGYDAGRADQKQASVKVSNFEAPADWKDGDWRKTGVQYVGAAT